MSVAPMELDGGFQMDTANYQWLCATVEQSIGVRLQNKENLVHNRLSRRARQLGLRSLGEYRAYVEGAGDEGLREVLDILTTNVTSFFRENGHFERLAEVLADFDKPKLRIWSSACSSGEEPYSIAMTVRAALPRVDFFFNYFLTTEINTEVLAHAEEGIYNSDRVSGLSKEVLSTNFLHGRGAKEGLVAVRPEVRALVTFRRLNLIEAWPFRGPFDVIFCRNVVIYFDKPTQTELFRRMANLLAPGGLLFIGHSEIVSGCDDLLKAEGNTTYRRVR
ncbi:MAG: chemotaxis protein CheR [Myxococcales bacterium]|nr:chemotaxis protein CheR [Myxococcales bacterium]